MLVLSIPDWGVTPFAKGRDANQIARDIDTFNAINRDAARRDGAQYVDVTPSTRRVDSSLLADDGLHPSAKAYDEWASLIVDVALTSLSS